MKTKKLVCYNCGGRGFITYTYENGQTSAICPVCGGIGSHEIQMTNADRIRSMSDEELAVWLVEKTVYQESAFSSPSYLNFLTDADDTKESAINGTVEWLRQPAEGDGRNQ